MDALVQLGGGGSQAASRFMHRALQTLHIGQGIGAGDRFDAAHPSGHAALGHHFEETNVARALHMGAAAQLAAGANVQYPHGFAVFLAEQHHGAGFLRGFDVHHPRLGAGVGQNFMVDPRFDVGDLRIRHRRVVGKVKAGALVVHQRAFLLHMLAQHLAQSLVHQVGGAVVAHRGRTHARAHRGGQAVAHVERALCQCAVVAKHIGLDLQGVSHRKAGRAADQIAHVAHLAAALGVKRGVVQHHHATLAVVQSRHRHAIKVERQNLGGGLQALVPHKRGGCAAVIQRLIHLELASRSGLVFLAVHGGMETSFIHLQSTFAADVVGQVQREAIGVVQFKSHFARQNLHAIGQGFVQDVHADFKRLVKPLFLGFQNRGDALGLRRQAGVGRAHEGDQIGHQFVEERGFLAQLVAVADGAADDAPLHIAAPLVGRHHTIADQKRSSPQMVGNHPQRRGA